MIDGLKKMMGLFTSGLEPRMREPEGCFLLEESKECYFDDPFSPRDYRKAEKKKYREAGFEEL